MPFIPHTENDIREMLKAINVADIENLFDEIPNNIRSKKLENIPTGLSENELLRLMKQRAQQDEYQLNFIGAGSYEHHIPAAVWDIVTRGEFMTSYTPYQAEASQGTLQLLYEYQTMMANLTGLDVSNASLYDGATALAEAVLMAVRIKKDDHPKILMPQTIHPFYRATVKSIVENQAIEIIEISFSQDGNIIIDQNINQFTALIIPQPNFFGIVEEVDALTNWAHQHQALVIGVVNPLAIALLKEPGLWGEKGADIVCGELQPFGIPLSSGGPYAGFMCCKKEFVRQMPGRIVGATLDKDGKQGFTLTLQAREQHIRRGKATSNICTNQGLLVTATTLYLSLLGFEGLKRVASQSHQNASFLLEKLIAFPHIEKVFNRPFFHEIVVKFNQPIKPILERLAKENILAGYVLEKEYPTLNNCLLICATETKTEEDLILFVETIGKALK
jgi:glycine dehydrogenase subunit 1